MHITYNNIKLPSPYNSSQLYLIGPKFDFTFTKKLFWTWEDIADPTDNSVDFSSLYDDNPNFKAMWDSPEFQKAMDDASEKGRDYNGLQLASLPNGD